MMKILLMSVSMFLLFSPCVFSQVIDDPLTMNMSRVEMGNFYLGKAKKQKRTAWILVGASVASLFAAAAVMENNLDNGEAGLGLLLVSTGTMIASWPTFARGARSMGMAEMLLTEPGQNPDKSYINNLATKYQKQAKTNTIIAWSMLAAGLITVYSSAWSESSGALPLIGSLAIYGSIPVFAAAAKNKGRVSVLVRNQSIPVSSNSSLPFRSIGVSIPITK
jgi:hypothetical protein